MRLPDKSKVREGLVTSLRDALETMARSAEDDRKGATHAENRQEGAKDMRATEQSYIARGKAMRAESQAEELGRLERLDLPRLGPDDAIVVGALIGLDVEGEPKVVFLVPQGGGTKLEVEGISVVVVSPAAPLGRALLGKHLGDDFMLKIRGEAREHVVDALT